MHCGRSYYGLTAAGYRIPFKPLMTLMQLFQCCRGPQKSPRRTPPVVRGAAARDARLRWRVAAAQ
jgi:hypothetical protein